MSLQMYLVICVSLAVPTVLIQMGDIAIAALINSSDYSLKIPVSDNAATNDRQINYSPQLFDKDDFQQQLTTLVRFWIGDEYLPLLKLSVTTVDGKTLGIVEVKKSPTPVFIKNSQS
ncbi:hypothetical protein H6F74_12610 [Trichocoleus sp. FACHB-90]|uniref:hypothetical protein n=1 Tax=Cyanophyceae TaxID=3028117 RepID=UPI0016885839|nr:hypothetical protein [Trichocoleus sp. FACHB-90]MBD1927081.1 hypothetical protein [Trichocoleus sp. FACHB-90]